MKKIILAAVLALGLTSVASAATISNPVFSNGDTTISTTPGSTVTGTFTLTVGANEEVEYVRTWVNGWPFSDEVVYYGEGAYTGVPFSVTAPPRTGNYVPRAQVAGYWGGNVSIHGGDNVIGGPTNLGTIRVVANGSNSGNTGGSTGDSDEVAGLKAQIAELMATVQSLLLQLAGGGGTTTLPKTCEVEELYGSLRRGDTGGRVADGQYWLINHDYSIPAIEDGEADYGFWGSQSIKAYREAVRDCG